MKKVQERYFLTAQLPYTLLGSDATNDPDRFSEPYPIYEKKVTAFHQVGSQDIAEKLLELFRYNRPEPEIPGDPTFPVGMLERLPNSIEAAFARALFKGSAFDPIFAWVDRADLDMAQRILRRQQIDLFEKIESLGDWDPGVWADAGLPSDKRTVELMRFRHHAKEWEPLVREELESINSANVGSEGNLQSVYAKKVKKLLVDCIEQMHSFRFCGPSDDPDEQLNVTLAYRDLVVQLKQFASPLLPSDMAAQLDATKIDVNDIYTVYEANPEVQALLLYIEAVLETAGENMPLGNMEPSPASLENAGLAVGRAQAQDSKTHEDAESSATCPIEGQEPDIVQLSVAILCAYGLRDLSSIRYFYPDAIEDKEAEELHLALTRSLEPALHSEGFAAFKSLYECPAMGEAEADPKIALFASGLLICHPRAKVDADSATERAESLRAVLQECQAAASGQLKRVIERLGEVKLYDCRMPTPKDDPTYKEPRRHLHMLREYWPLLESLILQLCDANCGWQPHPLMPLIKNLQARITACFNSITDLPDAAKTRETVEELFVILLSGQPDDFSVVPEWTIDGVSRVTQFLEDARLALGSKTYALTEAEDTFIRTMHHAIDDYHKRLKQEWARTIRNAEKTAKSTKERSEKSILDAPATKAIHPVTGSHESLDIPNKGLYLRKSTSEIWCEGVRIPLKGRVTEPFEFLWAICKCSPSIASRKEMKALDPDAARKHLKGAFKAAKKEEYFDKVIKTAHRVGYRLEDSTPPTLRD